MTSTSHRLKSIDALRGLVIVFMLLDHVRETFFLHRQVIDPMDVASTSPDLFFSRIASHLCAPVFVFLTGLGAFLYGAKHNDRAAVSSFLFKRGLFLVILEFTLVSLAWTFQFPPKVIYLQVIWAIGLSMIMLSALVWLPRAALIAIGLVLVAGHNLLDGVHFPAGSPFHVPWAILHDRGWIELGESLRLRTSYPLLPWIGVIALGYAVGPWFTQLNPSERQKRLLGWGLGALLLFLVLRMINGYGQAQQWVTGETPLLTVMSFLNITKYPPSLLFLSLTLGLGLLLLVLFERKPENRLLHWFTVFGAAPMFFYILHLYVLGVLYRIAVALFGLNQGTYFGFVHVWALWISAIVLAFALYWPVRWFAHLKARRRDITWLKYF
ncbi:MULTISPECIES: DUF1624 domain-containing protein [Pseudomonas]|uniref:Uncharacterized membrane protein n=1 Tax=Pseudomonas lutea TaxID=243924 RepID=A0A9X8M9P9_9PSED|nr:MULTISPECIES: DUF1624 domain-containing protein [Pseudomonas]MBW5412317.1 DUF1624 domain-containing protein [Pseudomonas sp. MAG002Y]SEP83959.1 Uncharacterized membrane protein [Pseudomonas lutea]